MSMMGQSAGLQRRASLQVAAVLTTRFGAEPSNSWVRVVTAVTCGHLPVIRRFYIVGTSKINRGNDTSEKS